METKSVESTKLSWMETEVVVVKWHERETRVCLLSTSHKASSFLFTPTIFLNPLQLLWRGGWNCSCRERLQTSSSPIQDFQHSKSRRVTNSSQRSSKYAVNVTLRLPASCRSTSWKLVKWNLVKGWGMGRRKGSFPEAPFSTGIFWRVLFTSKDFRRDFTLPDLHLLKTLSLPFSIPLAHPPNTQCLTTTEERAPLCLSLRGKWKVLLSLGSLFIKALFQKPHPRNPTG